MESMVKKSHVEKEHPTMLGQREDGGVWGLGVVVAEWQRAFTGLPGAF